MRQEQNGWVRVSHTKVAVEVFLVKDTSKGTDSVQVGLVEREGIYRKETKSKK